VCVRARVRVQALQQFHDISALDTRINDVFDFLDCDQSGTLSQKELNDGLKRLRSHTRARAHTHTHTYTHTHIMPTSSPTHLTRMR
jgi:Ca2+-binding EF-hand superfamily protein